MFSILRNEKSQNLCVSKSILNQKGLSLIEILIALTLLGIAGTFIVGKVLDNLEEGKQESAKIQIRRIEDRLKDYKRRCGNYPSSDQGLDALVTAPTTGEACKRYPPDGFIDGGKVPVDPWDNEFIYESDGRSYTIISLGSDGLAGGEGYDLDLNSKEL